MHVRHMYLMASLINSSITPLPFLAYDKNKCSFAFDYKYPLSLHQITSSTIMVNFKKYILYSCSSSVLVVYMQISLFLVQWSTYFEYLSAGIFSEDIFYHFVQRRPSLTKRLSLRNSSHYSCCGGLETATST